MKEELDKKIDDMKERMLSDFLKGLDSIVFVRSENSVTGEIEELNPVVQDMEATIRISGEWDREDLKDLITSISG